MASYSSYYGDVFDRIIVSLDEKRATRREETLASLIAALERFVPAGTLEGRYRDILRRCCVSIKKGSSKEAPLALRAVALLAITLCSGADSMKIMAAMFPLLTRIIEVLPDSRVVSAALECLAVLAFICAESLDHTEASMKLMWGLICPSSGPKVACAERTTSPRVLAAAVTAWTFVLTTLSGWKLTPGRWKQTTEFLSSLLNGDNRAVRMAAGEALAVCIELKILVPSDKSTFFPDMQARASQLATEAAGGGVDRTNFHEQKILFRMITAFLIHGEQPKQSVWTSTARKEALTVSTWTELVQLNFLRFVLNDGFQNHLERQGLMRQVFVIKELSATKTPKNLKMDPRKSTEQESKKQQRLQQNPKITEDKKRSLKKGRQRSYDTLIHEN
ncbi:hypothetical protein ABZP36_032147 [Zizania latifolia]